MALRLIPSGPRRKELSVVDLTVVGELSLPWDAKAEAALVSGGRRWWHLCCIQMTARSRSRALAALIPVCFF
jgi:hypothetical protein